MHKIVLEIFTFFKNIVYFLMVACIFLVMMLALYWIQNIIGAHWVWLDFIKIPLDGILYFASKIHSTTFHFWNAEIELKYVNALLLLLFAIYLFKLMYIGLEAAQDGYEAAHIMHKKNVEKNLNRNLQQAVINEEKRISKYYVLIQTKLSKKFSHKEQKIDIDEQNKIMNDFISRKTGVKCVLFCSAFLYEFDNFEKIDSVLDVLFKVMKSSAPLDYSISIQAGDDLAQLRKIASFENYGKITIAADTLLRYKYNQTHRYQTNNLGIFAKDEGSLEVHEFKEIE